MHAQSTAHAIQLEETQPGKGYRCPRTEPNTTLIAFSKASLVMISEGFTPFLIKDITCLPASFAIPWSLPLVAATVVFPGRDIPAASVALHMVLAVAMLAHCPGPGQIELIYSIKVAWEILSA